MHVLNNVYLFSPLCSIMFSSAFSSSLLVVVSFFLLFFLCVPHFSEIGSQSSGVGKTVMLFSICEVFASFSGAFFFSLPVQPQWLSQLLLTAKLLFYFLQTNSCCFWRKCNHPSLSLAKTYKITRALFVLVCTFKKNIRHSLFSVE